jgi:curli biogenesis system outer membrane secretion channel CsgG
MNRIAKVLALGLAASMLAATASGTIAERKLKMRVAVAPLDWGERYWVDDWQIPVEFRNAIYEKLTKKLLDSGKVVVLERGAMDALLKEQAIKEENTGQGMKGKTVPAQALVRGKVTDFSLRKGGAGVGVNVPGLGHVGGGVTVAKMGINVRIFSVDTSEVLASEDASGSVTDANFRFSGSIGNMFTSFEAFDGSPLGKATTQAIDKAVAQILKKLEGQPWSASVADFDESGKEATINAGSDLGVQEGDTFEVHRVTRIIRDPETGEVLGKKMAKIGVIKVTHVEKKFALAEVVEGAALQPGDVVKERK